MARITVEDCLQHENNRFALVLLAAKRAKQLLTGSKVTAKEQKNNKAVVMALREIADGQVRFMTAEERETARVREEEELRQREEAALRQRQAAAQAAVIPAGDALFKSTAEMEATVVETAHTTNGEVAETPKTDETF